MSKAKGNRKNSKPVIAEALVMKKLAKDIPANWVKELIHQKDAMLANGRMPVPTIHCRKRMEEKGIEDTDLLMALTYGYLVEIHRDNRWGNRNTLWRYDEEGQASIAVVLQMDMLGDDGEYELITFWKNGENYHHGNLDTEAYDKKPVPEWWVIGQGDTLKAYYERWGL